MIKIGLGYDVHPFEKNRKLILGGIEISNNSIGLSGHSDADVYTHSIIDALLGLCGYGSIGELFPENPENKDISSILLLKKTISLLNQHYEIKIHNVDSTIISNSIKISPIAEKIKKNISEIFDISSEQINIKGKSGNTLGIGGKDEGIEVLTTILGDVIKK
jgi:2-C-methyl-D-erythritol 2,4-cyclodiphosphate synthase